MEQSSQDLRVAVGKCFDVTLTANPTTGYSWSLSGAPALAMFISEKAERRDTPTARLGAATLNQVFHFKARQEGREVLVFTYDRAWDRFRPSQAEHSVRLNIVGP
jgi:inhibitor of cysteine peptidase